MKTDRKRKNRGNLLANLENTLPGNCFYTDVLPKGVTTYAYIYGYKVKTEITLCLNLKGTEVNRITKVTIL